MTVKTNYWFKRRRYGYGWVPVNKQGWLALAIWLLVVAGVAALTDYETKESSAGLIFYFAFIFLASSSLIIICLKHGPKPKWRWGKKPTDNPDEDF